MILLFKKQRVRIGAVLALCLLLLPALTRGQGLEGISLPGIQRDSLIVEFLPTEPVPGEPLLLRLSSTAISLYDTTVVWSVNGRTEREGIAQTEFEITLGPVGSRTRVDVRVFKESTLLASRTIVLAPAEVDLVWEANSYTPPFYEGKALPPFDGLIRIQAIPTFIRENGSRVAPRDIIFTWRERGVIKPEWSGRGKDSVLVRGSSVYRSQSIAVEAVSADGALRAQGKLSLNAVPPTALFYENDPLLGIRYERGITESFTLQNEEVSLTALPYYLSAQSRTDRSLSYSWSLNGSGVSPQSEDRSSITLRQSGGSGSTVIAVSIRNEGSIFEQASRTARLIFGGVPSRDNSF